MLIVSFALLSGEEGMNSFYYPVDGAISDKQFLMFAFDLRRASSTNHPAHLTENFHFLSIIMVLELLPMLI